MCVCVFFLFVFFCFFFLFFVVVVFFFSSKCGYITIWGCFHILNFKPGIFYVVYLQCVDILLFRHVSTLPSLL